GGGFAVCGSVSGGGSGSFTGGGLQEPISMAKLAIGVQRPPWRFSRRFALLRPSACKSQSAFSVLAGLRLIPRGSLLGLPHHPVASPCGRFVQLIAWPVTSLAAIEDQRACGFGVEPDLLNGAGARVLENRLPPPGLAAVRCDQQERIPRQGIDNLTCNPA